MKVLIPHTRELCYYSGSFFLNQIQNALEETGVEVRRLELLDDDFSLLEEAWEEDFDAVIDINSRLPRLMDEKGRHFLDTKDAAFFNIILDHPLYHHTGLSVRLKNSHAVVVDEYHRRYIEKNYPHIRSVNCIPMGGTTGVTRIPFFEREQEFLFSGTYLSEEVLEDRAFQVRSDYGDPTYQLMRDLYDAWDPQKAGIEDALDMLLEDYSAVAKMTKEELINNEYEAVDEGELLNRLYIVDQMKRNRLRLKTLTEAADTGLDLTVMGEGWEETHLSEMPNVRLIPAVAMELSFEITANSKYVIDSNPLFFCGLHDRVTSALACGCVCITDGSDSYDRELKDGKNILYYGRGYGSIGNVMKRLKSMTGDEIGELSRGGTDIWRKKYTWDVVAERLISILKR